MAASAWVIFDRAKKLIGNGTVSLSATGFVMTLHGTGASANLVGDITSFASIGTEASGGGYADLSLSGQTWTAGASAGEMRFDCTDPVFTASASAIDDIRYAVIRKSTGAGTGYPICYAALSTSEFNVTTGNTLTVQFNANGIFTLA